MGKASLKLVCFVVLLFISSGLHLGAEAQGGAQCQTRSDCMKFCSGCIFNVKCVGGLCECQCKQQPEAEADKPILGQKQIIFVSTCVKNSDCIVKCPRRCINKQCVSGRCACDCAEDIYVGSTASVGSFLLSCLSCLCFWKEYWVVTVFIRL